MTKFTDTQFACHAAAARLWPMTTIKAAKDEARAMGVMIRRDSDIGGFEVYPVGSPDAGLYAECPAEALALADVFAHDREAGRMGLFRALTLQGMAESLANRAAKAAGLSAGDIAAIVDPSRPRAGFIAFVFTGPHGVHVEHEIDIQTVRPTTADILCDVAPAAERAANEVAARTTDCDGTGEVAENEAPAKRAADIGLGAFVRESLGVAPRGLTPAAPSTPVDVDSAQRFAVFAHGTFWGTWDADTPEAACQMAADDVGTDGDTTGLEAKPATERGPRNLSAAANPDAPKRSPRRKPRTRAQIMGEIDRARAAGDELGEELARMSLCAADGKPGPQFGGFPLYAFSGGGALDPEELDSLAYGPAIAGLV